MNRGHGKYRGSARSKRIKKHLDRANKERAEMMEKGEPFKIEYWGWNENEDTPFLVITCRFDRPLKPVNFKAEIIAVLSGLFHEHIQGSQVSEQGEDEAIPVIEKVIQ